MVPLSWYLIFAAALFSIGLFGVLARRNAVAILLGVELMLNAVNLTFLAFSKYLNDMNGHVFVFMIMTVAAAEAAVGLAIIISLFRNKATINVDDINLSKG